MNELKPEDVMRALEAWIYDFKGTATQFCALCDAITLLKKYQAENAEKDAEIERLYKGIEELADESDARDIDDTYARPKIRDEAITEFALRLKSCEFYEVADQYDGMQYVDFCDWVDQIAKEMKGDQ
jgi:hypothetical protein